MIASEGNERDLSNEMLSSEKWSMEVFENPHEDLVSLSA